VSGEQLVKIVDFRGMFQWPAVKFAIFGLHHTIHHRGQLASYLRCMGAKVPAIYGESYDSALAKKASASNLILFRAFSFLFCALWFLAESANAVANQTELVGYEDFAAVKRLVTWCF